MEMRLLKPIHGWRPFAGEVGVIVLGVLLALGAQQVVQEFQTRADVRAFRETINHEIGLNLYIYDVRSQQFTCDEKRLTELKGWLDRARAREAVPPISARAPLVITPYRSAWDSRDAQVYNHLPARVRQKYAEFYDELSNNWSIIKEEQEQWDRLIPYVEAGPITLADRRIIRTAGTNIFAASTTLKANLPIFREIARAVGAKMIQPDGLPADWFKELAECPSLSEPPPGTRH